MKYIFGLLFIIIIFRLVFSMVTRYLVNRIKKSVHAENGYQEPDRSRPSKKKKITKDKGDYVDFEEIE